MNKTISITGKGFLNVTPDQARISFKLSNHQWKYEQALKGINQEVNKLKSVCTESNIPSDDLKSKAFNITKDNHYDKETEDYIFNGYIAEHRMELKLPLDNQLIGKLLESISQSFENLDFNISFGIKDQRSCEKQLLKSAVEDAKNNALILSEAAGVDLGDIINIDYSFSEIEFSSSMRYDTMSDYCLSEASIPDFNPDDIELNKNVSFIWAIK